MNKIILIGNLTCDPTVSNGGSTTVARYRIAVSRRFKREGDPDADFFNCTVFGKGAEFAEKYLKKGMKIVVVGRIESNDYTNKDGQKVYSWQVIVDEQEFAESKAASAESTASAPAKDNSFVDVATGLEDDLPFL
jgi:single-strand DNA-binding protein